MKARSPPTVLSYCVEKCSSGHVNSRTLDRMFFYFHLYVMMLSTFVVSNVDVGLLSPAAAVAEDEKVLSRAVEFKTGIFFVHRR